MMLSDTNIPHVIQEVKKAVIIRILKERTRSNPLDNVKTVMGRRNCFMYRGLFRMYMCMILFMNTLWNCLTAREIMIWLSLESVREERLL